jgi:hypothetical protein
MRLSAALPKHSRPRVWHSHYQGCGCTAHQCPCTWPKLLSQAKAPHPPSRGRGSRPFCSICQFGGLISATAHRLGCSISSCNDIAQRLKVVCCSSERMAAWLKTVEAWPLTTKERTVIDIKRLTRLHTLQIQLFSELRPLLHSCPGVLWPPQYPKVVPSCCPPLPRCSPKCRSQHCSRYRYIIRDHRELLLRQFHLLVSRNQRVKTVIHDPKALLARRYLR